MVVDGAHTPASGAALSGALRGAFPGRRLALVVAMASDKDCRGFAEALATAGPAVVVLTKVQIAGSYARSAHCEALQVRRPVRLQRWGGLYLSYPAAAAGRIVGCAGQGAWGGIRVGPIVRRR